MFRSILLFQLMLTHSAFATDHKISFIVDFLKSQIKPTYPIILQNCFSINDKLELVKNIFNPTTFHQQDSLKRSDFERNPHYCLFILDLTCTQSTEGIIQKIDSKLFQHPYRWIIFTSDDKILKSIRALVDSDILIPQIIEGSDGEYKLRQFYKIDDDADSEIYYEHYGKWSEKSGLVDERKSKVISSRRKNLHGKIITTSYAHTNRSTKDHLTDFVDKNIDSVCKVNYILVNTILDTLNVTKKELFQMTWGYYNIRTKKWSGMIGDMLNKGADIGGTPMFIITDRIPFVDYTILNLHTQPSFIFRAPQLSAVYNIYSLPFNGAVWLCCLILVIISTILFHLTSQTDSNSEDNNMKNKRITDSALSTVAAVCQMDSSIRATVTSSRIIMFCIFLAFAFLYSAYTANIVSLLQSPSKSIKTLEDLYNSKIELGIEETPYTRFYAPNVEHEFHKKVYLNKINKPFAGRKDHFMPLDEGIARVRKGLFAFYTEESPMYKVIENTFLEHEKCGLINVDYVKFADPYLAIQKNSPYREILRVSIAKSLERGIQRRIFNRIYTKKPVCVNRLNFQSIGINDAQSALMLLPFGIVLAFVVLLFEKLLHLRNIGKKICLKF